MNPHYNQAYTKEQIKVVLQIIQDCVRCNRYIIATNENRLENREFIKNYQLSTPKQKDILLKIVPEDFCHSLQNTNSGYEREILYVFCPQMMLHDIDDKEEMVDLYIKFNIIDYDAGKEVITISFHKRNKPIDYLFR